MKILVSGGTKSGKSSYVFKGFASKKMLYYCSSGELSQDSTWTHFKNQSQSLRPFQWSVLEGCRDMDKVFESGESSDGLVFDCLTLWLSWSFQDWVKTLSYDITLPKALNEIDHLISLIQSFSKPLILITNEVGAGVVPSHPNARLFRNLLGTLNQKASDVCDTQIQMFHGQPLMIKPELKAFSSEALSKILQA